MDTDDFSEMAWEVLVQAAQVSDTLKSELGALSKQYINEDDWLRGVQDHLEEIIAFPEEYVEFWGLEECERVTAAMLCELAEELNRQVEKVQATPMDERGKQGNE